MHILVVGAAGFVGSRLTPRLRERGHNVRSADSRKRHGYSPPLDTEQVVELDVSDIDAFLDVTRGIDLVFYLRDSHDGDGFGFQALDRTGARNLVAAAERSGVRRIVILSGLADDAGNASAQLRSRHEVGEILRGGSTPVTEFRAGLVVGAGAPSMVMLRQLVERLPLMLMPKWVTTRTQPIAIDDLVRYLVLSPEDPVCGNVTYEIGGPEVMTYRAMMERYARLHGWRRLMVQLPVTTPKLSSYWVDLVTSLPDSSAGPLIEGLREATVVQDDRAIRAFGPPEVSFEEALRRASARLPSATMTEHSGVFRSARSQVGGFLRRRLWPDILLDERVRVIATDPQRVWNVAVAMGGRRGYPILDVLWRVRGAMDRLVGGPGLNRRGPSAEDVAVGDQLDFWRITEMDPGRRLRLRALMKVPGDAELEIAVRGGGGVTVFAQTARFRPSGVIGRLYWWALYPVHWIIFRGMADRVARIATS
jgi:uncharacterized protein YbjT (DUF2867 family)